MTLFIVLISIEIRAYLRDSLNFCFIENDELLIFQTDQKRLTKKYMELSKMKNLHVNDQLHSRLLVGITLRESNVILNVVQLPREDFYCTQKDFEN